MIDRFKRLFGKKATSNYGEVTARYNAAIGKIGNIRETSDDANSEIYDAKQPLRDRASYAVRNFTIAESIVRGLSTNIIGGGIRPQVTGEGLSVEEKQAAEQKILKYLNNYNFSADGRANFFDMQISLMRSVVERGEALVLLRRSKNSTIPFAFQPLEGDHLDDGQDGEEKGKRFIQGIEYDQSGKRSAYWLYKTHPGSSFATMDTARVPANQVLHIFRRDRLGQERGVSWLAPALNLIAAFSEFFKISMKQQELSAMLSVVVSPDVGIDVNEFARILANQPQFKGGQLTTVAPGSNIHFVNPPPQGGAKEFRDSILNSIASGVGMTTQALFSDYSSVNFSSGRLAELQFSKSIKYWQQSIMVAQFCAPIGDLILNHLKQTRQINQAAEIDWVLPSREHIQPREEANAAATRIAAGITSRKFEQRKVGIDPETIQSEIDDDLAKFGVTDLSQISTETGKVEND